MSDQNSKIERPKKVRYSSLAKKRAAKRKVEKRQEKKVDSHHPAPVVGQLNEATQKEQESSLGLGGVTKKEKKARPMRQGPKRRYSNVQEKKDQKKKQESSGANSDSGTGSGSTQQ